MTYDPEVVVVGAGPTGMAAAILKGGLNRRSLGAAEPTDRKESAR